MHAEKESLRHAGPRALGSFSLPFHPLALAPSGFSRRTLRLLFARVSRCAFPADLNYFPAKRRYVAAAPGAFALFADLCGRRALPIP